MQGEKRVIFGLLFVVVGPFLMLTSDGLILGILLILGGLYLLITGFAASRVLRTVHNLRDLLSLIVPPNPQTVVVSSSPPSVPTESVAMTPDTAPSVKYCPDCGAENTRTAAFCKKCGKPLPPPP
jgi:ribosomal protein L40E